MKIPFSAEYYINKALKNHSKANVRAALCYPGMWNKVFNGESFQSALNHYIKMAEDGMIKGSQEKKELVKVYDRKH